MTDAREALRERVADAIAKAWGDEGRVFAAADAAIAVCMEEAAKVAIAKSDEWTAEWRWGFNCDSHLEGMSDGADDIAAALRATIARAALEEKQ